MISLKWVKDYIDISDQDLDELAVKITKAGINIEQIVSNKIANLVIGEIITIKKHPDSDHLNICQVNIGSNELYQIVCGASNVKEKMKVIVALPGAILKDNFVIKKSKIRGVESNGMLCALFELGLEEKNEDTYAKGICELAKDAPIGEDPLEYLGVEDTLYELDVHKHRNNDCYSHIGFAYEIAAILNRKVTLPDLSYQEIDKSITKEFQLQVKTDKCPYYLAKMVTDIKIGESPEFIKQRLISAGMRPINNVVDISNYVMLEFGQPLHFFDKDKLGNKIVVRNALDNEEIITLDGKLRSLKASDIVITDGTKPVCIAGVMGGENTEVDQNSKTILIESAIFDAVSIRYTSSNLNLKSEASIRYGKGLNYEYTNMAIARACHLLEKYAGAKIYKDTVCHDTIDKTPKVVRFKKEDINRILGINISQKDIEEVLHMLDFSYQLDQESFIVQIPNRRLDIDPNINDIAEEIGRLYGYHNLHSTLPNVPIRRGQYIGDVKYRKAISKRLRRLGLTEVKTYTLVSREDVEMFNYQHKEAILLPNPMSMDKSVIRISLLPSLLKVYQYNKARKVNDIFIYEISKTYDKNYEEDSLISGLLSGNYLDNSWQHNGQETDFYLLKGIIEDILNYMGFNNRYSFIKNTDDSFHPGVSAKILLDKQEIGIFGRIHPQLCKDNVYAFELSLTKLIKKCGPLKFIEAPKYPGIEKDMAFIVDQDIPAGDIMMTIKRAAGHLLNQVDIFDVYKGENIANNKKSVAFKLQFVDYTKTLTDEEVMTIFNKVIETVKTKYQAILRDK